MSAILLLVFTTATVGSGLAQVSGVVPIRLARPAYPAIALSARVSGDVEVAVGVRADGTVESAVIVSGPQLLQQAALEAALQSQFECRGCSEGTTPYSLVFAFKFDAALQSTAEDEPQDAVRITASQGRVTVVGETPQVRILFAYFRMRSAKCLYLWRCVERWGGEDFYYTRVRSPSCLWLWKCGLRKR